MKQQGAALLQLLYRVVMDDEELSGRDGRGGGSGSRSSSVQAKGGRGVRVGLGLLAWL